MNEMTQTCLLESPLGLIQVETGAAGICSVVLLGESGQAKSDEACNTPRLAPVRRQLEHYFAGKLQLFDLPIDFSGYSDFSAAVLQALQAVPFGSTVSYGELAARVGRPAAARAVGRIVGANRTPLIIPCHRVIGKDGALVGYSAYGGVKTKRWLLDFEQAALRNL